ncbi:MAG: glycosyltransferase family 9 protein [Wenzhouxiangella sp.]|nr:glycosyltransferase family 9 protein [Wenzhouxiangella sp.]
MPDPQTNEPPGSVCLLRLSALGDVCNTVPLVRAIQRAWPETALTWIVGKAEHRLVHDLPGVEFIVFDKRGSFAGFRKARRQLAGRRFDTLLLAQVSQRSSLVASLVRAGRRIGFDKARSRPGHGLVTNEHIDAVPFQHQVDAFLEFARHLGLSADGLDRRLPVPEDARAFAREHQPEAGRAVIISPASSHTRRNWHAQGYAAVADWVVDNTGRPVILMGGPGPAEKELGQSIEARVRNPVVNLIGRDTIKQALAMFERAACVVAPDSGPAHFADAMGTPVVGLYAATWARRSGPINSLDHTVDRFPQAAREFAGREPEELRWGKRLERPGVMALITPEMVIEKLGPLLVS